MAESRKAQLIELLLEMGGGAGAGILDVETSASTPGGFSWGAIVGAVGALGVLAVGPDKMGGAAGKLGDLFGGALAFESGAAAVNWRLKSKTAATPQAAGLRSVAGARGALGGGRTVVSQADLFRSLGELERMANAAA